MPKTSLLKNWMKDFYKWGVHMNFTEHLWKHLKTPNLKNTEASLDSFWDALKECWHNSDTQILQEHSRDKSTKN